MYNYLGYAVLMNDKYWSALPVEHQENINQAIERSDKMAEIIR